jgi:hypothetical protein
MPKMCRFNKCISQAAFNIEGGTSLYCGIHKQPNMINVKNKSPRETCIHPKCKKCPSYNFIGLKAQYCSPHSQTGMIDLKHTKCKECDKIPTFNYETETKGEYCSDHKLENMVDVVHDRCKENGCNRRPNFNIIGKTKAEYCSEHKSANMIDVTHKQCIVKDCNIQPTFNLEGQPPLYCSTHKLAGMVSKNKKCEKDGCNTFPTFNVEGQPPLYCSKHKLRGMVNNKKKCQEYGCIKRPNSNYKGEKYPIYCSDHKLENMIDVITPRCEYDECELFPCYNYIGKTKAIYCLTHKKVDMIDVKNKSKLCKTPLCITRGQKKYKNLCVYCFINTYPDQPISRNYKTKEKNVVDHIIETFPSFTWVVDKKVQDGCSRRRPDLLLDMGLHIIIIEIDENKHIGYDSACQIKRLNELSLDLQCRPIVFIRFNPDAYINQEGKQIKSCWKLNKTGITQIIPEKQKEWGERINSLKQKIEYWIYNYPTNNLIEIVELFY